MEEENQPQQPYTEKKAEAASSTSLHIPKTGNGSFVGRHRMAAAIAQLNNQITMLRDELDQLDTLGESSIACRELVESVSNVPDPLLPQTRGPANAEWDKWFRGTHCSRRRWI